MEKQICNVSSCYSFGKYCRIPGHCSGSAPKEKKESAKKSPIKKNPPTKKEKDKSKERNAFFQVMIARRPKNCQESGKPLIKSMAINPRSIVAHILPKRDVDKGGVPSMQYDERNILYLDQDVHTDMDRQGEAYITKMKLYPVMKKRVEEMWPEIPENERKNVPQYLRP